MTAGVKPIDCDVHPFVPGTKVLMPWLDANWQEQIVDRGIASLDSISYPPNSPLTIRGDFRRDGLDQATASRQIFDRWGADRAILNCIYGVQLVHNTDMAIAFTRALNQWIATEWLAKDKRFAASIVLPLQDIEACVDEIEFFAANRQFVQVLVLANGEAPLGKRQFWPIWRAAEKHGLPVGIHAGSSYRHPVTSLGWTTYYVEDYAAQSLGFQAQLASLVTEGVFVKFPGLKVVLLESGVTWLPGFIWRLSKFWRGVRREIPWVDRPPGDIIRDHVRMSIQPIDGPEDGAFVDKLIDQIQSDEFLLYASDYPHWQFDGDDIMPKGIPAGLHQKIMRDNPLATYTRLGG
jgi:predicted TIM-barrel fold metal-dependent hydrolase